MNGNAIISCDHEFFGKTCCYCGLKIKEIKNGR